MKAYNIILKGASISLFGLVFSRLISYITIIIISKTGSTNLGLLNLGLSVVSFIAMIFLLGLHGGVLRYVSYYLGKKNKERIKGAITSALKIAISSGILAMILVLIFAKQISINIFNKPELTNIITIFAFMIPFLMLIEIFSSIFLSFKKIGYNVAIRDIGEKIIRLFLVGLAIYLGFNLKGITYAYLFTTLLIFILILYLLRKKEFHLFNKKINAKFNTRELIIYSLPLILTSLLTLLQKWADTFILGFYRTASEVGIYNISFSTAALLAIIPTALMSLFIPVITDLYGQNKIKDIKRISNIVAKWIFMVNVPLSLSLIIFAKDLLRIVFGQEYILGYVALDILAISYLILSITHVYASNLLMVKKTKLLSFLVFISTFTNIFLNIILIPKFGIVGAAIATLVSTIIFLISMIISSLVIIKLQPLDLSFIKIIFSIILSGFLLIYIKGFLKLNLFIIILLGLLMLIIYIIFLFILKCFSKEDINLVKELKNKINYKLNNLNIFNNK